MKILFAAPDRDLLECYRKLLEFDANEIVTAFDGTQVLSLLSNEAFDLAVLDEAIPRIPFHELTEHMRKKKLPVIGLIGEPLSVHRLTGKAPANTYLSYPFDPAEMKEKIEGTCEKAACKEKLDLFGHEVNVADFQLADTVYLTSEEIDVLRALLKNEPVTTQDGAAISALNEKFRCCGCKAKILYRAKKGFELVRDDE